MQRERDTGFDIDLEKEASELSVGQLQRIHLARGLSLRSKILLLDEPTSALDALNKENVEVILRNLVEEGGIIIMVTMI